MNESGLETLPKAEKLPDSCMGESTQELKDSNARALFEFLNNIFNS